MNEKLIERFIVSFERLVDAVVLIANNNNQQEKEKPNENYNIPEKPKENYNIPEKPNEMQKDEEIKKQDIKNLFMEICNIDQKAGIKTCVDIMVKYGSTDHLDLLDQKHYQEVYNVAQATLNKIKEVNNHDR